MKDIKKVTWPNPLIIVLILLVLITDCKKEEKPTLPIMSTNAVINIASTTSTCGGKITSDGNATIIERGICWSIAANPTISLSTKTSDGSGSGTFTSNLSGLTAGTNYHVRAYATNSVGTGYGNDVTFTTIALLPVLTTTVASSITENSAASGGNITADGGASISERGVCWGPTENPTISLSTKTSDGSGIGSFTSSITGLIAGATYHVRAFATNQIGTAYGNDVSFTTNALLPSLTTTDITSITANSASSGGNISADGGAPVTSRGICWSTSADPTISLETKTSDGTGIGIFTSSLTSLSPGITYHVRAYATNTVGTTYGNEVSFTSNTTLPTISTTAASSITATTVHSGGNISADGGAVITSRGVCWSTAANPTIDLSTKTNEGTGIGEFTSTITGLDPGTSYHLRAYALNSVGTAYGDDISIVTSTTTPSVLTTPVTSITSTSVSIGGEVTDDGGATVIARGICWGLTTNPIITDNTTIEGNGLGAFTSSITGLTMGTAYFARAYATNSAGTSYGSEVSFTTLTIPSVNTTSVSSISQKTATSGGNVISDGGAPVTVRGVCWSTTQNPTVVNNKTIDGNGIGVFTSSLSGLQPNTTYYIKSYATNSIGTGYGDQIIMTTLQIEVPILTTTSASDISYTTATSGGEVTYDGGGTITSRGVCWSTLENPTIGDSKTTNGAGLGIFSSSLTGLQFNTVYYVRAYATNSIGTGYGDQISFSTLQTVVPTISTTPINNILYTSASGGGSVSDDGGSSVTARGVCWSETPSPTVNDNKTIDGSGIGTFLSNVIEMTPNTTYFLRAYATNSTGTGYGNQESFTTLPLSIPVVIIDEASNILENTATCSGTVQSDGGSQVTLRGFCWNTTGNPTISDMTSNNGTGLGVFSGSLTGLSIKTTYYVRAYAINSIGTSYSNEVSFTTIEILNDPVWLSYDDGIAEGQIYSTVPNNQFIVRFTRPASWGTFSLTRVQVFFGINSTYYIPKFNILCYTTYYTTPEGIVSPSGSGSTLLTDASTTYLDWMEYYVSKTINTNYFFVSLKHTNYNRMYVGVDVKSSQTDLSSIVWDKDGVMYWINDSYLMIRAYVEDVSGKGTWIDGTIEDVVTKNNGSGTQKSIRNWLPMPGFGIIPTLDK